VIGAISLGGAGGCVFALYQKKLAGGWRTAYVVTAVIAPIFQRAVLIAQSFMKITALQCHGPTGEEGICEDCASLRASALNRVGVVAGKKFKTAMQ